jgi:hypothetical protein
MDVSIVDALCVWLKRNKEERKKEERNREEIVIFSCLEYREIKKRD